MSDDVATTVNVAAEAALLHAVLTDPAVFDDLADAITTDMFIHPLHRSVWSAIVAADSQGRPLDSVSVADEMRRAGDLDRHGGIDAIEQLRRHPAGDDTVADSLTIITDHAVRRRLWSATDHIRRQVADPALDTPALIGAAELAVSRACDTTSGDGWTPMAAVVADLHTRMATPRGAGLLGTPTGLEALDRITGGLCGGQLILIGARPGMGKSVLALQIAAHIASVTDTAVPFLSYEMSCDELGFRLLAAASGVDLGRLQRGAVPAEMARTVAREAERLATLPLLIDDRPPRTIGGVRSAVRRLARRTPIGAVVLDYLQLMSADRAHDGRTGEISEISREAKLLAVELGVPVIACSQLSRNLMTRPDKRPQLSDLRESGSLEQDSNIVLFVHREHVFDDQAPADSAEIIVGKNRNGPAPATVAVRWDGPRMRFRHIPDDGFGAAAF